MIAGGRLTRVTIVDVVDILNDSQIRAETFQLGGPEQPRGCLDFETPFNAAQWFAKHRLLKNSMICARPYCGSIMSLVKRSSHRDGYEWRCKECKSARSIRYRSLFAESHLTLKQILGLMYGWAKEDPQNRVAQENFIPVSSHAVVDWFDVFREICGTILHIHPTKIGGLTDDLISKVVEIDENLFSYRKRRGKIRNGHWVYGGIERDTRACFLVRVPDRTATTWHPIIERYIEPGTIIIDQRQAYDGINWTNGGEYDHQTSVNLVNPALPDVYAQNIEHMWQRVKAKMRRQCGTSDNLFPSYLDEMMWRSRHHGHNILAELIVAIAEIYPS